MHCPPCSGCGEDSGTVWVTALVMTKGNCSLVEIFASWHKSGCWGAVTGAMMATGGIGLSMFKDVMQVKTSCDHCLWSKQWSWSGGGMCDSWLSHKFRLFACECWMKWSQIQIMIYNLYCKQILSNMHLFCCDKSAGSEANIVQVLDTLYNLVPLSTFGFRVI